MQGYDFVDHTPYPYDRNGHGTFVAGTIAEATNNRYGLTGLAFAAQIMPVRVLNSEGEGDATTIAEGVRFAVDHGARVINLSLEFSRDVSARDIPQLMARAALRLPQERRRRRGRGQRGAHRDRLPGEGPARDRGGRHHRTRVPGRTTPTTGPASRSWLPAGAPTPTCRATRTVTPKPPPVGTSSR